MNHFLPHQADRSLPPARRSMWIVWWGGERSARDTEEWLYQIHLTLQVSLTLSFLYKLLREKLEVQDSDTFTEYFIFTLWKCRQPDTGYWLCNIPTCILTLLSMPCFFLDSKKLVECCSSWVNLACFLICSEPSVAFHFIFLQFLYRKRTLGEQLLPVLHAPCDFGFHIGLNRLTSRLIKSLCIQLFSIL